MRIMAIDPGTSASAFVVWDGCRVHERGIVPNRIMRDDYINGSIIPKCDMLVIEKIECYGMAIGASTIDTIEWIGRFDPNETALLVPRRAVKIHHCGSMKAKDANVRQALIDRFGEVGAKKKPGPLYGISTHLWSALAIAVYVYDIDAIRVLHGCCVKSLTEAVRESRKTRGGR